MAVTLVTTGSRGGSHRLVGHIGDPLGRQRCPYTPMVPHPVQIEEWEATRRGLWTGRMVAGTRIRGKLRAGERIWLCHFCEAREKWQTRTS